MWNIHYLGVLWRTLIFCYHGYNMCNLQHMEPSASADKPWQIPRFSLSIFNVSYFRWPYQSGKQMSGPICWTNPRREDTGKWCVLGSTFGPSVVTAEQLVSCLGHWLNDLGMVEPAREVLKKEGNCQLRSLYELQNCSTWALSGLEALGFFTGNTRLAKGTPLGIQKSSTNTSPIIPLSLTPGSKSTPEGLRGKGKLDLWGISYTTSADTYLNTIPCSLITCQISRESRNIHHMGHSNWLTKPLVLIVWESIWESKNWIFLLYLLFGLTSY